MDVSYYYSHNNDDENDLQAQENALQFMVFKSLQTLSLMKFS